MTKEERKSIDIIIKRNTFEKIDNFISRILIRITLELNLPNLLAWYASKRLKIIEPEFSNNKTIFALSHFRFRGELEMLSSKGYKICFLNPLFVQTIQHFFYKNLNPTKYTHHNPKKGSVYFDSKEKINQFYKKFLKNFNNLRKINFLISPMAHYTNDMHLGSAGQEIGIPYIVLHRAGIILNNISLNYLVKRYKKLGNFKGQKLLVQNNIIKNVFLKSKFCNKNQIEVIGSTRLKSIIDKKDKFRENTNSRETLTLFSFTHALGRSIFNDEEKKISYDWINDSKKGLVNFFYNVHKQVILFALNNPNFNVIIKLKWGEEWFKRVQIIVDEVCDYEQPKNLKIVFGNDGTDYIIRSKVVIAFGSTVILESGLLGKHVIMPIFDEAADDQFAKFFPLNEAINACYLAESPDAIVSLAESLLYTPSQGYGKNKRMKVLYQKYLGSLDDNPDQKLINLLKNI